jgi:hypothetical protein
MSAPTPYPAFRYDEDLVLKVPLALWLSILFLVRHFLLLGVTFIPGTGDMTDYLRDLVEPLFLASDAPAAAVLLAAVRRRSSASRPIRALWAQGRTLLAISAASYLVVLGAALAVSARPLALSVNEFLIASVFVHTLILVFLARSRLIKDVFAAFPRAREPRPHDDEGDRRFPSAPHRVIESGGNGTHAVDRRSAGRVSDQ